MSDTFESPMKNHPLGLAARYNDADCEERGFEAVFPLLGLELKDVLYLSEQRALRVVTGKTDTTKRIPVMLTREQRVRLVNLQSCVVDGIVIGWRGHQIRERETSGYVPPTPGQAVEQIRAILRDFEPDEAKSILRRCV